MVGSGGHYPRVPSGTPHLAPGLRATAWLEPLPAPDPLAVAAAVEWDQPPGA
jgi:hypothetical protein